jgi:hypothetical protein
VHAGLTGFYGVNQRNYQDNSGPIIRGVQVGTLHPLKIWLHPPAICKMSNTNMLIGSDLHEDNITELMHEKSTVVISKERLQ